MLSKAEVKAFINSLEVSDEQKVMLEANMVSHICDNVEIDKRKGKVTFDAISDFVYIETLTLSNKEMWLFEFFHSFLNNKVAAIVIFYCLENKVPLSEQILKDKNRLTPKVMPTACKTFTDFYNQLSPEGKLEAQALAENWLNSYHDAKPALDFYFMNGSKGVTFVAGNYLKGYDDVNGNSIFAKVLYAAPKGFVLAATEEGFVSVTKAMNPTIITKEQVPTEFLSDIEEVDTEISDLLIDQKNTRVERLKKSFDAAAKKAEAALAAKAEKEVADKAAAEAVAAKEEKFKQLMALELKTPADIEAAVAQLNDAKLNRDKTREVSALIKAAKKALTPASEPAAEEVTPPAESKKSRKNRKQPETEIHVSVQPTEIIAEAIVESEVEAIEEEVVEL